MELVNILEKGKRFARNIIGAGILSLAVGCSLFDIPRIPSFTIEQIAIEPNRIMRLRIQDYSNNESGFTLERKVNSGDFSHLADLPSNADSYEDVGVAVSTTYTYRIRASNESGNSGWWEKKIVSLGPQKNSKRERASADAMVFEYNPNRNFGAGLLIVSGTTPYGGEDTGLVSTLLSFTLSPLPIYATYKGASLTMRDVSNGNIPYPIPIELYAALNLEDWNEDTVTWYTQPSLKLSDEKGRFAYVSKNADNENNGVVSIEMDVSRLASYWYSNKSPNYGINLYTDRDDVYWRFGSREGLLFEQPTLNIDYYW
jgi:hypothetical protein